MQIRKLLIVLILTLVGPNLLANVWQTKRPWDANVEKDFAIWVQTHWSEDIFISPLSPYRGIETDCAQATYAMRIIFLYENALPLKFRNHNLPNSFITNEMTNWDSIADSNQRLRAFLKFVFSNTSTRTLGLDSYPVSVTPEEITSGAIYVDPGNHSVQVIELTPQGIPVIQFSTTPSSVRFLTRLVSFPEMIPGQAKTNRDDGFRRFKSPDQVSMSLQTIAGYSLEQFSLAGEAMGDWTEYTKIFTRHLARASVSINSQAQQMIENICRAARDRVRAVRDAMIVLARNSAKNVKCLNEADYYNTSTPDRDKVLREYFIQLKNLTLESVWAQADTNDFSHQYANVIVGSTNASMEVNSQMSHHCDLKEMGIGGPERSYLLSELYQKSWGNYLVSDPNASLEQRWGVASYVPVCKQY